MKKIAVLFFVLLSLVSFSQTRKGLPLKEFTRNWKSDSLGKLNFRNTNHIYSATKQTILINGIDFRGFSEKKVLELLGKPNESGIHKEDKLLIMIYKTKYFKAKQSDEILVYYDEKNEVNAIIKSEDKSDLYFKK